MGLESWYIHKIRNMHFRSPILLIVMIFSISSSTVAKGQKYKLASGKEITVIGINEMKFENRATALIFNYQTDVPIENHDQLKGEAEEIWTIFQHDVERANAATGIIRATHIQDDGTFVKDGKGFGFLYRKNAAGKWSLDESRK
jgi:hypothetical protein